MNWRGISVYEDIKLVLYSLLRWMEKDRGLIPLFSTGPNLLTRRMKKLTIALILIMPSFNCLGINLLVDSSDCPYSIEIISIDSVNSFITIEVRNLFSDDSILFSDANELIATNITDSSIRLSCVKDLKNSLINVKTIGPGEVVVLTISLQKSHFEGISNKQIQFRPLVLLYKDIYHIERKSEFINTLYYRSEYFSYRIFCE